MVFGRCHRALGPNPKGHFFVQKKARQKSASLEPFIFFLAFVVQKQQIN